MRDTLLAAGYSEGVNLWHFWEPGAEHNEAAWAARIAVPVGIFAAM